MMGTWFLATAYSSYVAAQLAAVATSAANTAASAVDNVDRFIPLFDQLFWTGLIAAAVLLTLTPVLKRLMHGIH